MKRRRVKAVLAIVLALAVASFAVFRLSEFRKEMPVSPPVTEEKEEKAKVVEEVEPETVKPTQVKKHKDYEEKSVEIEVMEDKPTQVSQALEGLPGRVLITSKPSGKELKPNSSPTFSFALEKHRDPAVYTKWLFDAKEAKKRQYEAAEAFGVPVGTTNSIGMKLVLIPAGEFMMGSPLLESYRDNNERPRHKVKITKPFYMGRHEVTQSQYEAVMRKNASNFKGANNPVECVSWNDAVEFCRKLTEKEGATYRLPTEAEWEYACRAGTTTAFHYGDSLSSEQANFDGSCPYGRAKRGPYREKTVSVGGFKPNAWGLYDMHGNVWEWCNDWYDKNYYTGSPVDNPEGPGLGDWRVLRGGSWRRGAFGCRSADRFGVHPHGRRDRGFRCARTP